MCVCGLRVCCLSFVDTLVAYCVSRCFPNRLSKREEPDQRRSRCRSHLSLQSVAFPRCGESLAELLKPYGRALQ